LHEAANKNLVAHRHGTNRFSSSAARVAFVASAACNTLQLVAFARLRKGVLENVAPACAWHKTAISPAAYNTFNLILLFPIASKLSNGRPFVPFCGMQEGIIVPNYQRF
jgi:hypothetical protein